MVEISYRRHRFPPVIIQQAIWLYLRFTLSYRHVEELLAERGFDISYETVRCWGRKSSQARQFSIASAFCVGDRPNALKAEPIEQSQNSGIILTRPGHEQRLSNRAMILRSEILSRRETLTVPIAQREPTRSRGVGASVARRSPSFSNAPLLTVRDCVNDFETAKFRRGVQAPGGLSSRRMGTTMLLLIERLS
jgi:hypothetical protein